MAILLSKPKGKEPYIDSKGNVLPGVTTVIGILDKPFLVNWAWSMGRKNKRLDEAREGSIDVGNLVHHFIECFAKGEEPELDADYLKKDIALAKKLFGMFEKYFLSRKAKIIASELRIIDRSETVGGTLDMVVDTDAGPELWDFKTSSDIWPEYYIQVAAYDWLYLESTSCDDNPIWPRIIQMSKTGWFDAPDITKEELYLAQECWHFLRYIYPTIKQLRDMTNPRKKGGWNES